MNLIEVKNNPIDFVHLKSLIERMSFNAVGVCNGSDEQHKQAKAAGLSVLNYSQDVKSEPPRVEPNTSVVENRVFTSTNY